MMRYAKVRILVRYKAAEKNILTAELYLHSRIQRIATYLNGILASIDRLKQCDATLGANYW